MNSIFFEKGKVKRGNLIKRDEHSGVKDSPKDVRGPLFIGIDVFSSDFGKGEFDPLCDLSRIFIKYGLFESDKRRKEQGIEVHFTIKPYNASVSCNPE